MITYRRYIRSSLLEVFLVFLNIFDKLEIISKLKIKKEKQGNGSSWYKSFADSHRSSTDPF